MLEGSFKRKKRSQRTARKAKPKATRYIFFLFPHCLAPSTNQKPTPTAAAFCIAHHPPTDPLYFFSSFFSPRHSDL